METTSDYSITKRIEDLGRAREALNKILEHDLFDDLSKHSREWKSEDEIESDKLDDIRCKLSWIEDELHYVMGILCNDE